MSMDVYIFSEYLVTNQTSMRGYYEPRANSEIKYLI